jgi:hypothetical protein
MATGMELNKQRLEQQMRVSKAIDDAATKTKLGLGELNLTDTSKVLGTTINPIGTKRERGGYKRRSTKKRRRRRSTKKRRRTMRR